MSDEIEYPALQNAIGARSAAYQNQYLWLVRGEYFLLLVASVLAMDFAVTPTYFLIYALIFLAALGVMLIRSMSQPCLSGCYPHPLNVGWAHSPEYSPSNVGATAPPAIPSSERNALKG